MELLVQREDVEADSKDKDSCIPLSSVGFSCFWKRQIAAVKLLSFWPRAGSARRSLIEIYDHSSVISST